MSSNLKWGIPKMAMAGQTFNLVLGPIWVIEFLGYFFSSFKTNLHLESLIFMFKPSWCIPKITVVKGPSSQMAKKDYLLNCKIVSDNQGWLGNFPVISSKKTFLSSWRSFSIYSLNTLLSSRRSFSIFNQTLLYPAR